MDKRERGEALISAWLALAGALWSGRIVSGMTFNEVHICNHLNHADDQGLTATQLCQRTGLLKSQMNKVLTDMERKGHICRQRSGVDRRQINIRLTYEGKNAYLRTHEQVISLTDRLVDHIGIEQAANAAASVLQIANLLREIIHYD